MALLELKGITAGYGQNVILRDFNLNVSAASLTACSALPAAARRQPCA